MERNETNSKKVSSSITVEIMKMTAGFINIPDGVKEIFAHKNDEATAEIWFKILNNELLCPYILCPNLKPKAMETALASLSQNEEIQVRLQGTACAYLEYAQKHYSKIMALKKFFQVEQNHLERAEKERIYEDTIFWLENHMESQIMLDYAEAISDFVKIIIFTKSDIMENKNFKKLFDKKRWDFIALMQ